MLSRVMVVPARPKIWMMTCMWFSSQLLMIFHHRRLMKNPKKAYSCLWLHSLPIITSVNTPLVKFFVAILSMVNRSKSWRLILLMVNQKSLPKMVKLIASLSIVVSARKKLMKLLLVISSRWLVFQVLTSVTPLLPLIIQKLCQRSSLNRLLLVFILAQTLVLWRVKRVNLLPPVKFPIVFTKNLKLISLWKSPKTVSVIKFLVVVNFTSQFWLKLCVVKVTNSKLAVQRWSIKKLMAKNVNHLKTLRLKSLQNMSVRFHKSSVFVRLI